MYLCHYDASVSNDKGPKVKAAEEKKTAVYTTFLNSHGWVRGKR